MKEREIDLIDLLVEILLHWRMFIILTLAGTVLLGGFNYICLYNEKNNLTPTGITASQFSEEEMQNVAYVVAYETAYNAKNTYLKESPLMNIDSNHVNIADATVAIIAEDHQKSCDIEKVYEDILQSGELYSEVAKEFGMETASVNELISLTSRNNNFSVTGGTTTLRINVIHNDEIQCQNMLEFIIAFLKKKQPDIENVLGIHEIVIVNKSFGIVSSSSIATTQQTVLTDIATMKSTILYEKGALSDAEKQYYSLLTDTNENNLVANSQTDTNPKISIKHILLGAIIFPILYMLILFIIYIFNTRIRITDNLQELYNIPQLGVISTKENPKKFLEFIDKWILSLQNHIKRRFTYEEALDLTIVAVKISTGKEMLQEIHLMGCGLKERSLDICEEIKSRLVKDNIQVTILNNVLYDAQMMEELEEAKGVVLIESAGSTLYNEVFEELNLLKRQGIKVLGGVLVD